ncbi:MAG: hypothetical protein ABI336_01210 [Humibacillus sp.]
MTSTLHIEHPVRDFDTWKRTFDGFHDFRVEHDVRSYRVGHGADDASYVTIDLLFDDTDAATAFRRLLVEQVWRRQQATGVLAGAPTALVVDLVEDATVSP